MMSSVNPANEIRARIEELIRTVLNREFEPSSRHPEVLQVTELMCRAAGFEIDRRGGIDRGETRIDRGLALSPTMAAMCAEDYMRTIVFWRGVHEAITRLVNAKRSSPCSEPVRVLYAGTGPLAMLCVPLMTVLPECVRFTLLDLHEGSVRSVRGLVDRLGLGDRIDEIVRCDACEYRVDPDAGVDVIVSETMLAGLNNEPQVSIFRHLLSQAPDAILVPESVRVDAVLIDPSKEYVIEKPGKAGGVPERVRVPMGCVFELCAQTIRSWEQAQDEFLPGNTFRFPDPIPPGLTPMLFTTVRACGEQVLIEYQSGLTTPIVMPGEVSMVDGGEYRARYRLGDRPGLEFERVQDSRDL